MILSVLSAFLVLACVIPFSAAQLSCRGRCGEEYYRGYLCNCDYECLVHDECCKDYESQCTTRDSCKGRCGEVFKRGRLCSCDVDCRRYNQCCPDYTSSCDAEETTKGPASTTPANCNNVNNNKPTEPAKSQPAEQPKVTPPTLTEYEEVNQDLTDNELIPLVTPESEFPQDPYDEVMVETYPNIPTDTGLEYPEATPIPESTSGYEPFPSDLPEPVSSDPSLAPTTPHTDSQDDREKEATTEETYTPLPEDQDEPSGPLDALQTQADTNPSPAAPDNMAPPTDEADSSGPTGQPDSTKKQPVSDTTPSGSLPSQPTPATPAAPQPSDPASPSSETQPGPSPTENTPNPQPEEQGEPQPEAQDVVESPTDGSEGLPSNPENPDNLAPVQASTPASTPASTGPTKSSSVSDPFSTPPDSTSAPPNSTSSHDQTGAQDEALTTPPTSGHVVTLTDTAAQEEEADDAAPDETTTDPLKFSPVSNKPTPAKSTPFKTTTNKPTGTRPSEPTTTTSEPKPTTTTSEPKPTTPTSEPKPKPTKLTTTTSEPKPKPTTTTSEPKPKPNKPSTDIAQALGTDSPRDYQADDNNDTNLCSGRPTSAVTTLRNGTVMVFRGHYFWMLDSSRTPGPPRGISEVWGVPSPIDTVFTRCNCQGKTYILKGPQYWRFENGVVDTGYPKPISTGFDGLRGQVTAALSVPEYRRRQEAVYFFKRGGVVQKYSYKQGTSPTCGRKVHYAVYTTRSRTVRQAESPLGPTINIRMTWKGFPSTVTSAVSIPNRRMLEGYSYYVFSRSKYYNVKMEDERPALATPVSASPQKNSAKDFFNCPKEV